MHASDVTMRLMTFDGAVERDPAIDGWLAGQRTDLAEIARTWFDRFRACGDDVRELMHDGHPTACVGQTALGYVAVYRSHVGVGFFLGAELDDPAGLLEGSGRRMRHVKLRSGVARDEQALGALIDAAYRDLRARLEG